MCINIGPLLVSFAFALFGIYLFAKSQRQDSDLIPEDDGGTPSWLFYLFCVQIYYLFKREKKYKKNFPNNYFAFLKFFGLMFILTGFFFIYLSLFAC